MAKHVATDTNGRPTAFYDDVINAAIPAGTQVVTNAQYDALIASPLTTSFVAGVLGTIARPLAATPPMTMQAQMALGAGLAIVSTASAAALSGTYGLDGVSMSLMRDLADMIAANGGNFPGGASSWSWPDAAGALHSFASASTFTAFANAMAVYRLALYGVIWGSSTTLPATTATIP